MRLKYSAFNCFKEFFKEVWFYIGGVIMIMIVW